TDFISARVSGFDGSIFLGQNQFFTGELVQYLAVGTALGGLVSGNYYYVIKSSDGLSVKLASVVDPTAPITPLAPLGITPTGNPLDSHSLRPAQRFTVKAGHDFTSGQGDAYLDIKARRRDDPGTHQRAPVADYSVIIDAVVTSGNADLRIWGS